MATGVAWTAIQQANAFQELYPEEALETAGEALRTLGSTDIRLQIYARSIATHSLITLGKPAEALRNFNETRHLYEQIPDASTRRRIVGYLEARLLGALGCVREADKLFRAVASGCWDFELYRDSFVVRLAWFEFHFARSAFNVAAEVCREAIKDLEEAGCVHPQMVAVWRELLVRVEDRLLDSAALRPIREYVMRHWFAPAEQVPSFQVPAKSSEPSEE